MNILILSDFHIDIGDKFGTFRWNADELIAQIEKVRTQYDIDQVILNGDIYELYKYKLNDIEESQKVLVNYLKQKEFVFIRGNHDVVHHEGLNHYMIRNSIGQTIYIEHGHEADFINGTRIGRFISRLSLCSLKKVVNINWLQNLYFKIVEFNDEINRIPKKYNSYKYLKYALKKLKDYDVVILGHTHKIETHHTYYLNKKKRYLNCGSCSMGRFQGIVLDTESLRYTLIKTDKIACKKDEKPAIVFYNRLHTAQ